MLQCELGSDQHYSVDASAKFVATCRMCLLVTICCVAIDVGSKRYYYIRVQLFHEWWNIEPDRRDHRYCIVLPARCTRGLGGASLVDRHGSPWQGSRLLVGGTSSPQFDRLPMGACVYECICAPSNLNTTCQFHSSGEDEAKGILGPVSSSPFTSTAMSAPDEYDFLSLDPRTFPLDVDDESSSPISSIQPHLDTLFAEFARSRPRTSVSRSDSRRLSARADHVNALPVGAAKVDLRALEYLSDYDPHLVCPICHVPFVEPVVLDCDHTFCSSCFEEYKTSATNSERSQCPTCRTFLLASPRKASRLIVNMCSDIKVRCLSEGCDLVLARGYVEHHLTKECPEALLECPGTNCDKKTKRKNFVPEQCIHDSHIVCDCGAVIELGRGEWLRHKDEVCPSTGVKCSDCGGRISAKEYLGDRNTHTCPSSPPSPCCPGAEFGCDDQVAEEEVEAHSRTCPLARLAPHMKKQAQLLQSLQEQLAMTKVRNEVLEAGFEKIDDIIHNQVLPRFEHSPPPETEVEEIERDEIPGHRELTMPPHLHEFNSPEDASAQQHLLALHEQLRENVSTLENDMTRLCHNISDVDARTSMQLMNETLRIKEELAHTNAALFSTRSQVQWLLNRERVSQQARGRAPSARPGQAQAQTQAQSSSGTSSHRNSVSTDGAEGGTSVLAGEAQWPSPNVTPLNRPPLRRLSGSQERVKL